MIFSIAMQNRSTVQKRAGTAKLRSTSDRFCSQKRLGVKLPSKPKVGHSRKKGAIGAGLLPHQCLLKLDSTVPTRPRGKEAS